MYFHSFTVSMLMLCYVRACGCSISPRTPFVCSQWVTVWLILYVLILAHCHVPCYGRQLVTACMCSRPPYVLYVYGEWAPHWCISYVYIFTQREVPCYCKWWMSAWLYVCHSFNASYVFSAAQQHRMCCQWAPLSRTFWPSLLIVHLYVMYMYCLVGLCSVCSTAHWVLVCYY